MRLGHAVKTVGVTLALAATQLGGVARAVVTSTDEARAAARVHGEPARLRVPLAIQGATTDEVRAAVAHTAGAPTPLRGTLQMGGTSTDEARAAVARARDAVDRKLVAAR